MNGADCVDDRLAPDWGKSFYWKLSSCLWKFHTISNHRSYFPCHQKNQPFFFFFCIRWKFKLKSILNKKCPRNWTRSDAAAGFWMCLIQQVSYWPRTFPIYDVNRRSSQSVSFYLRVMPHVWPISDSITGHLCISKIWSPSNIYAKLKKKSISHNIIYTNSTYVQKMCILSKLSN